MLKLKTISFLSNTQTRGTLRFRFILIVIINQINFSVIYRYYISFSFFNFSSFVIIIIIFFMTWSIILYDIETRIAWSYHELSSIEYSIYICAYFAFLFFSFAQPLSLSLLVLFILFRCWNCLFLNRFDCSPLYLIYWLIRFGKIYSL